MTCPACQEDIRATTAKSCPHCGARIMRMESGVIKTSAVIIVSDKVQAFYPSLRDVPEPLRTRVVETTSGRNSGTIVIADRRGKEEIEKAARTDKPVPAPDAPVPVASRWRRVWPALLALIAGALSAWLAMILR